MTSFSDLGVRPRTLDALRAQEIIDPTPVQRDALPPLLGGRDAVIEAPTGSGKTLAFVLPLVERLRGHAREGARALIVGPTRELAVQVAGVIRSVDRALRVAVLHGGVGYGTQLTALDSQPDVVVGCPGRILDLLGQGRLRLDRVELLILDEADEMLDAGFARDVERILDRCPDRPGRQRVLASATMPDWVQRMIDRHLDDPFRVRIAAESEPDLEHGLLAIPEGDRLPVLHTLLRNRPSGSSSIVFTRTKHGAKKLANRLGADGHTAVQLQGNLSQNARDRAIAAFRDGTARVLVATNVAARGLDVSHVGLVVNFELPETAQWLTHRVGRTARNGTAGRAITFITESDQDKWRMLERGGAPRLPHLDADALLKRGEWLYADVAPASPPRPAGMPSRAGRRRRRR